MVPTDEDKKVEKTSIAIDGGAVKTASLNKT